MSFRKELFGLDEVGAELESMGAPRWHLILLSDLQQGVLRTVVKFPSYRETYTPIPSSAWKDDDVARLFRRPGRRGWKSEFDYSLSVNDFFEQEEQLLQQAVRAAALRELTMMPAEFRSHMEKVGLLNPVMTEADWQTAIRWLLDCWKQLSDVSGNDPLYPMVEAHRMSTYLLAVKEDRGLTGKPKFDKHPGGRPESPNWGVILEAAIKKLACRPSILQDGEVQEFAEHLYTVLKKLVGGDELPSPNADTIAQRLRTILKRKAA